MSRIEGPISVLVKIGLIDVILPFVLMFAITYGILRRTKVLGKEQKRANILLALGLSTASVLAVNVLDIVNALVMYLTLLIVMGVLLAMVFGLAGAEMKKPNKIITSVLAVVFGITVLYVLVDQGVIDRTLFFNRLMLPLIILVAIVATIVYMVKKNEEKVEKKPETITPHQSKLVPPSL